METLFWFLFGMSMGVLGGISAYTLIQSEINNIQKNKRRKNMNNYLCIEGNKIELTSEQITELKKSLNVGRTKLSDVKIGETFKIGKYEFIVLDHSKETTAVILKDLLHERKEFGKNNNYANSYVDGICNNFADEIKDLVGARNLIEHTVDLTADDGLKDYGKTKRFASLLTANLYRRYVEILDKYKLNKWWWLATAYSTPKHGDTSWVKCVSPSGFVNGNGYYDSGVRPFCILNSNIFVSSEE